MVPVLIPEEPQYEPQFLFVLNYLRNYRTLEYSLEYSNDYSIPKSHVDRSTNLPNRQLSSCDVTGDSGMRLDIAAAAAAAAIHSD